MFFSFQTLCMTGNVPECYLSDYDYYINSAHRIPEHRLRKWPPIAAAKLGTLTSGASGKCPPCRECLHRGRWIW